MIQDGFNFTRVQLNSNGSYILNRLFCNSPQNIILIGEDSSAGQQSIPVNVSVVAGINNIPVIQACGISMQQFLNYSINGTSYSYIVPPDGLILSGSGTNTEYSIFATNNANPNSTMILFNRIGIATGSVQNLFQFRPVQIIDSTNINGAIGINITEYGNVGQYMSGNFSGVITGSPPSSTIYNITCAFRIKRTL